MRQQRIGELRKAALYLERVEIGRRGEHHPDHKTQRPRQGEMGHTRRDQLGVCVIPPDRVFEALGRGAGDLFDSRRPSCS